MPTSAKRSGSQPSWARSYVAGNSLRVLVMEPPVGSAPRSCASRRSGCCARSPRPRRSAWPRWPCAGSTRRAASVGEPVPGYPQEPGVPPGSTTETYTALRLNWRAGAGPACRSICVPASAWSGRSQRSGSHSNRFPTSRAAARRPARTAAQPAPPDVAARRGGLPAHRREGAGAAPASAPGPMEFLYGATFHLAVAGDHRGRPRPTPSSFRGTRGARSELERAGHDAGRGGVACWSPVISAASSASRRARSTSCGPPRGAVGGGHRPVARGGARPPLADDRVPHRRATQCAGRGRDDRLRGRPAVRRVRGHAGDRRCSASANATSRT